MECISLVCFYGLPSIYSRFVFLFLLNNLSFQTPHAVNFKEFGSFTSHSHSHHQSFTQSTVAVLAHFTQQYYYCIFLSSFSAFDLWFLRNRIEMNRIESKFCSQCIESDQINGFMNRFIPTDHPNTHTHTIHGFNRFQLAQTTHPVFVQATYRTDKQCVVKS